MWFPGAVGGGKWVALMDLSFKNSKMNNWGVGFYNIVNMLNTTQLYS